MLSFILMVLGWVVYLCALASGETHLSAVAFGLFVGSILSVFIPNDYDF